MAELLVRVRDKINSDFYLNCQCTKRGDVIVVQADGWAWGKEELSNPDWRIIKIPSITVSEALAYTAPELDVDLKNPSKTLQRRAFRIDIDNVAIPAGIKAYLLDNTRATSSMTLGISVAAIRALKTAKAPVQDPAVFGSSPNVF